MTSFLMFCVKDGLSNRRRKRVPMSDLNYLNSGRGSGNGSQEVKRKSLSFREILLINNYCQSTNRFFFLNQPSSLSPVACVFHKKSSE